MKRKQRMVETTIFYVDAGVENKQALTGHYDEEGSFEDDETARALGLHVTAVGHYESQGEMEKQPDTWEVFKTC
nr:hypothetical protein [Salicibibacter kimchii]